MRTTFRTVVNRPLFSDPLFSDTVPFTSKGTPGIVSPHGASTQERQQLFRRFSSRLSINLNLTRQLVSYQGNKRCPGLRWMKYKEGFSHALIAAFLEQYQPDSVLDPFAGIGTTPLVAAGYGKQAMGIELMPIGVLTGQAIFEAANQLSKAAIWRVGEALLDKIAARHKPPPSYAFPHVTITSGAFPASTEQALAKARQFLDEMEDNSLRTLLNLACMSVLEESSYTRKDGQYLRWDNRSGRKLRAKMHKGAITPFHQALEARLHEITEDLPEIKEAYGRGHPQFKGGSCLELLKTLPADAFDMVITSPPYANRYDYTRTYALELAWLDFDQTDFADLRQQLISATVENRTKRKWLQQLYGDHCTILNQARSAYEQPALHEVLKILTAHQAQLSNKNVIRLIEGYFFEMAVLIAELARVVRPGGKVIMINDNVQYHGEELPVDLILSDYAEQLGFDCQNIWVLARGKGNSSQQMGKFGRRELRKCVYQWSRR